MGVPSTVWVDFCLNCGRVDYAHRTNIEKDDLGDCPHCSGEKDIAGPFVLKRERAGKGRDDATSVNARLDELEVRVEGLEAAVKEKG